MLAPVDTLSRSSTGQHNGPINTEVHHGPAASRDLDQHGSGEPGLHQRDEGLMKLLLTSFGTSDEQDNELEKLIGKKLAEAKVAYIENAHDVYDDEASLQEWPEEHAERAMTLSCWTCGSGRTTGKRYARSSRARTSSCSPAAIPSTFGG